jgi:hypothetical protein
MVSLEVVAILLSGISISASLYYYSSVLQNANKTQQMQLETRQTQLYQQLFNRFMDDSFPVFWEVLFDWSWSDYDDFMDKYGFDNNPEDWNRFIIATSPWENMGILIKEGMIDPKILFHWMGPYPLYLWDKVEPVMVEYRNRNNIPSFFEWFEDIYYCFKELQKEDDVDFLQRQDDRKRKREQLGLPAIHIYR